MRQLWEVEQLLRPTGSWENDIKKYVKEIWWEGVGWTLSVNCEHDKNKTMGPIKRGGGGFLD